MLPETSAAQLAARTLKERAEAVAASLRHAAQLPSLDPLLRAELIETRRELYTRGIYDPVLGSFDSVTVQHADLNTIAERLAAIAQTL